MPVTPPPAPTPAPPIPAPTGELLVSATTGDTFFRSSKSPNLEAASEWKYELDTLVGMSLYFYEINRAGRLPADTRVPWRGDTLKKSGGGSLDGPHEGGYFDAGDHNKFMLPESYAIGRICWLAHAFQTGLKNTYFDGAPNYKWAIEACKWGADFLVKGIKSKNEYLLHIGDIRADHNYLGRSESYPQIDRNILYCRTGTCSDITGEAAGALAHAAVAFKEVPALRDAYWRAAKTVYAMTSASVASRAADFGNSNDVYTLLKTYYPSTGVASHVFFGSASMFAACKALSCGTESLYQADAEKVGLFKEADGGQKWYWEVPNWDNGWWDGAILMVQNGVEGGPIYGKPAFTQFLQSFADKWAGGKSPLTISPLGQRYVSPWASNRFALGGAAILLHWANLPEAMRSGATDAQEARCTAVKQIHYVAGDNDRGSYIVGFGTNSPKRPHHRNGACAPWEQALDKINHCQNFFVDVLNPRNECGSVRAQSNGVCYPAANRPNKFTVHGAMVGGPKTPTDAGPADRRPYSETGWNDWRTDWVGNEITLDYSAVFLSSVSAALELPKSFWTSSCSGAFKSDLQLTSKAGLSRDRPAPSGATLAYKDFVSHGWTRTLGDWYSEVPTA